MYVLTGSAVMKSRYYSKNNDSGNDNIFEKRVKREGDQGPFAVVARWSDELQRYELVEYVVVQKGEREVILKYIKETEEGLF